ncbi:MAG: exosortase/archaeosortase family protein [Ardenticatenales bacterium]|nr:exosortase/archaeosortase family protein [Ardenticatenales bacterium]
MPKADDRLPLAAAAAALIAAAVLFAPAMAWVAATWRVNPYYSHGPLVAVAAVILAWRAAKRLGPAAPSVAGLALVVLSVAAHALAARYALWPASALALVGLLAGACLIVGGPAWLRAFALPLALLALAIPLPWVAHIAPRLASAAAGQAAALVGPLGVDVIHRGPQLIVGDGSFQVGAPCSGLRSIVALVTLAVGLAGTLHGPRARRWSLVALAVPLALVANTVRLSGLLVVAEAFGTVPGLTYYHGLSSPVLFAAAVLGLLWMGRAMGCDVVAST